MVLDIEMPVMDGLETLAALRQRYPQLVVVMFSTLTERGAATTLQALSLGADDYVTKIISSAGLEQSLVELRRELGARLRQFFHPAPPPRRETPVAPHQPSPVLLPAEATRATVGSIEALAIGSSTGGPAPCRGPPRPPLNPRYPDLRRPAHAGAVHPAAGRTAEHHLSTRYAKPPTASMLTARHLDRPGDYHMRVERFGGSACLNPRPGSPRKLLPPLSRCAVSFVADTYQERSLAVVLTGMGRDGQRGAACLKAVGSRVLAQDEETSVVWGMPGAVVAEDLADWVLPLERIAPHLVQHLAIARRAAEPRSVHERR